MTASDIIPEHLVALLNEPNFGFLGTIRPDDTVQVNPMWFEFDGELIRFTHTTKRQKYRNLQRNPSMSLAVVREQSFYRYLEIRGRLVEVVPDPDGEFYVRLARRYGETDPQPPKDRADRVILVMSVEHAGTN
ncbi:PPOX class F420-dependent oxidoreductase [Planctomonas sp. JC2975]|uniref:PPOX class F420-dependent oxidoreductase n=1 Tax=Planctomonas sp. JC2975 TaxID=2729626 RepID=UPI0014759DA2|nr:PPOX class F420-dependent oxidoreductase [Planctomonas sp. JC2975]NNC11230.1 PPOX class F420-dependent oxidoreductase [Planctomonas sp. JC2975]